MAAFFCDIVVLIWRGCFCDAVVLYENKLHGMHLSGSFTSFWRVCAECSTMIFSWLFQRPTWVLGERLEE
jgi:hypothetical protein